MPFLNDLKVGQMYGPVARHVVNLIFFVAYYPISLACFQRYDFTIFALPGLHRVPQLNIGLESHPEFNCCVEEPGKAYRGVRSDGAFPGDDLIDPDPGYAETLRQLLLGKSERLYEFIFQDFSRRYGSSILW